MVWPAGHGSVPDYVIRQLVSVVAPNCWTKNGRPDVPCLCLDARGPPPQTWDEAKFQKVVGRGPGIVIFVGGSPPQSFFLKSCSMGLLETKSQGRRTQ